MIHKHRSAINVELAPKETRQLAHQIAKAGISITLRSGESVGLERIDTLSIIFDLVIQLIINASPDDAREYMTLCIARRHAQITGAPIDADAAPEDLMQIWGRIATAAALQGLEPEGSA